jgi:hypothetical protein
MHPVGIIWAADEAVVFGWFEIACFVTVRLAGHAEIVTWNSDLLR